MTKAKREELELFIFGAIINLDTDSDGEHGVMGTIDSIVSLFDKDEEK
jgi:hypothetical protein